MKHSVQFSEVQSLSHVNTKILVMLFSILFYFLKKLINR